MRRRFPAAVIIAVGSLLAAGALWAMTPPPADAAAGKVVFEKRCTGCHALDADRDGPRLRGVYGRKAGSVPSFQYSDALRKSGITWDSQSLDKWLTEPDAFVKETDMPFRVADPDERSALIQYLKELPAQ
jgi:cytochrome c